MIIPRITNMYNHHERHHSKSKDILVFGSKNDIGDFFMNMKKTKKGFRIYMQPSIIKTNRYRYICFQDEYTIDYNKHMRGYVFRKVIRIGKFQR